MNENHQRHLIATFRYVDKLLAEAEQILVNAGSHLPFQEYSPDSTPVQRKVIQDYSARIRQAMARIMAEQDLPRPAPVSGALWAAQNHFAFASIAVAELEPNHLRGYGELTDADCQAVGAIVADLNALIDRVRAFLAAGASADLQARLARLAKTTDESKLLRELERIITTHGLVEFRGALTRLLDKLEASTFEIGIFGRVSCGKSSLLNYLLEDNYLPVGVTPVTAIPTHVSFGSPPLAMVEFAEDRPLQVELSRLAEFSTEQQNPGNQKHVTRLRVQVPARRLKEGMTLVDTPGLGSLATTGAEETMAYLPRCDLGLVLIDAGSALTHEDLTVLHALYTSGATATVLISKADLLTPGDRQRLADYVRQQLAAKVNLTLPVHLVSVVGADAALCQSWLEQELKPLLDSHREQAARSLKRKVGALRETVVRTLETRRKGKTTPVPAESMSRLEEVAQALRRSDLILEAARNEAAEMARNFPSVTGQIIDITASELVETLSGRKAKAAEAAATVSRTVARLVNEAAAQVHRRIAEAEAQLSDLLRAAKQTLSETGDAPDEFTRPSGQPIFDAAAVTHPLQIRSVGAWRFLGKAVARRRMRRQLEGRFARDLRQSLALYSTRMRTWVRQTSFDLQAAFAARAQVYQAQIEQLISSSQGDLDPAQTDEDLRILGNWAGGQNTSV